MKEKVDYYAKDFVQALQRGDRPLEHREEIALRFISGVSPSRTIDLGCGDGLFLSHLRKRLAASALLEGAEASDYQQELAVNRTGLKIRKLDLETDLPSLSERYDMIYSGEVIEHVVNPDKFLKDVRRILCDGGHLVLTTPNLNSWLSRIMFLLGLPPANYEFSSVNSSVGYSWLKPLKKQISPVGHIRLFNRCALIDLLKANGFEIICISGARLVNMPRALKPLDFLISCWPSLSSVLVVHGRAVSRPEYLAD